MNHAPTPASRPFRGLLAGLSLCTLALGAVAAAPAASTVNREAAAARLEAKRGGLTTPSDDAQTKTRLLRCNVHKEGSDRELCQRRMTQGETSGSVSGGGIIRTHEETVYAEPK